MKKIQISCAVGLIAILTIFQSCSKGGSSGGGTTPPPPPPPAGSSLAVSMDKSSISADGWETVTFTVKDQNNNDVTGTSSIFIGNVGISGNTFFTSTPGTYQIKATRSGVTSPDATLTVANAGPSPFSQKILVEDYTGTWCGHCPRVGIPLESYHSSKPNAIIIAPHGPAGSSDPYTFSNHTSLANSFQVSGYPTVVVDRDFKWNENTSQLDAQFTNRRPPLGMGLQTIISGNTINITAQVKFDVTTAVNLKLVTYLVEDGKVYPQVNYGYFGMPNPISNYVHNAILRKTGTDLYGDNIPVNSQVKGTTYEKVMSIDASGYDISKCRIISFVVIGPNTQGRKERSVVNVQAVKAGLNQSID